MFARHQNKMSILCTLCGKEYPTEKHLQIHIANTDCNSEDQQVKRKCSTCEQEILGNRKYLNHLATHETISCKHCKIEIPKNSRANHKCKAYEMTIRKKNHHNPH